MDREKLRHEKPRRIWHIFACLFRKRMKFELGECGEEELTFG